MKRNAISLCWLFWSALQGQILQDQTLQVSSPDQTLHFKLSISQTPDESGVPVYSLQWKNKTVILDSRLGIVTAEKPAWTSGFTLVDHRIQTIDETWRPVYGEKSRVRNHYTECIADLLQDQHENRKMQLIIRVYNTGAAFSYFFPE
ncbi:glycoside hydrolase family 97 protein, partial [bacterium]|nr:glycoside hydrolase family 97 protein [bacterium]